jgi:hypothetical protein
MPNIPYIAGSSSATYSNIVTLLGNLPDNNQNLIQPQNIRDPVWTLYQMINDVSASYSVTVASSSSIYNRSIGTPISVGGVSIGTTFSGSVQDALDKILYPYVGPGCSLSGGNSREFGSSNAVTLSWSVTKHSNPIISIIVNGTPISPTGNNQSGSVGAVATQNVNTTFNMSTSDGTTTPSASTSVSWFNKRYWGTTPTFAPLTNSQILALNGAGVGSGNELASSRVQTRNGINGGGSYLVFAWPTSFGTPAFVVNGLPNTAFTLISSAFSFTNANGYVNTYDVWISNTAQNSPIASFQIN